MTGTEISRDEIDALWRFVRALDAGGCYRCQPGSTGGGLCDRCRITLLGEQVSQLTLEVRDLRAVVNEVRPPVAREQRRMPEPCAFCCQESHINGSLANPGRGIPLHDYEAPVAREQLAFRSEAGDAYRAAVRRADEREVARDDYLRTGREYGRAS